MKLALFGLVLIWVSGCTAPEPTAATCGSGDINVNLSFSKDPPDEPPFTDFWLNLTESGNPTPLLSMFFDENGCASVHFPNYDGREYDLFAKNTIAPCGFIQGAEIPENTQFPASFELKLEAVCH
jgi:hypothetical protein